MDDDLKRKWEGFLDPDVLRPRLIVSSIYIAIFEAMQDQTVKRVKDFYTGWVGGEERILPEYRSEVLGRNSSPTYASLDWLRKQSAIDDNDVKAFDSLRQTRNEIAHTLLRLVASKGLPSDLSESLSAMISLFHKIEVWWVKNIEIPTNPDFDSIDVLDDDITPGMTATARMLMDVALGPEDESRYYIREFRKNFPHNHQGPDDDQLE